MARRRTRDSESALINAAAIAVLAIGAYLLYMAVIDNFATQQATQAQAARLRLQQQLPVSRPPQVAPAQQRSIADAQAARWARDQAQARFTEQAAKDAAWDRFYHDPEGCDNWRTDAWMVKCLTYKTNEKHEFERLWAAGQFRPVSRSVQ